MAEQQNNQDGTEELQELLAGQLLHQETSPAVRDGLLPEEFLMAVSPALANHYRESARALMSFLKEHGEAVAEWLESS